MSIAWNAVAAIGGIAGVVVSLTAQVIQIRRLRKSIQSATYQSILQRYDGFVQALIQYPELYELFFHRGDLQGLSREDRARAELTWTLLFNWYEALVLQSEVYQAVPRAVAEHWDNVLREDLREPAIKHLWDQQARYYHPQLQARVAHELRHISVTESGGELHAEHPPEQHDKE